MREVDSDEGFYPRSLEKGLRSERALKLAIAEMYVQGVSTRKVVEVTRELCGLDVSSTQVSRAAQLLDKELEEWRQRPLGEVPYVVLDARYEKVRHGGAVVDCAVLIAIGVREDAYDTYAHMDEEDIFAVVTYLRTLPPIDNEVELPKENWPMRLLGRVLPKPYKAPQPVDRDDPVAYGRYLSELAECSLCHGSDFSGERLFQFPGTDQESAAANTTPHESNRFGTWAKENFVGVFKSFSPPEGRMIPGDEINTVMPWWRYSGMTEEDLGAIYEYLRTSSPVEQVRAH